MPGSKLPMLGMVIPPLIGILIMGILNPIYYWLDDHPLLYGNDGSLDPSTCKYPYPDAPNGTGLSTNKKGRKWPHEQGEMACKVNIPYWAKGAKSVIRFWDFHHNPMTWGWD